MKSRVALLICLQYTGTEYNLPGTVYDCKNIGQMLSSFGYVVDQIDDKKGTNTGEYILSRIRQFVQSLKVGDQGFLYFAGHGIQFHNSPKVEGIIPSGDLHNDISRDHLQSIAIYDRQLKEIVQMQKPGSELMIFFDACHSGDILDLAYNVREVQSSTYLTIKDPERSRTPAYVVGLASSQDHQEAFEVSGSPERGGLGTEAFLQSLQRRGDRPRYIDLLQAIAAKLPPDQRPALAFGDRDLLFSTVSFF